MNRTKADVANNGVSDRRLVGTNRVDLITMRRHGALGRLAYEPTVFFFLLRAVRVAKGLVSASGYTAA